MLCSEQTCVDDGQLLSGVYSNHVQRVLPFTTDSPGEEQHNDLMLSEKESFINSLNNWYFGKAIFSRSFSARYHILKKKKLKKLVWADVAVVLKTTILLLVTYLVSLICLITFRIIHQTLPDFQGSLKYGCRCSLKTYMTNG